MIQTIQLTPGVVLRHYPDKRFKTAVLSIQFQRPLCREEAALNALLSSVLLRGTAKTPICAPSPPGWTAFTAPASLRSCAGSVTARPSASS